VQVGKGKSFSSCNGPNVEEELETCSSSSSERTWDNAEVCDSIMWQLDGLSESTLTLDESDHPLRSDSPTSLGLYRNVSTAAYHKQAAAAHVGKTWPTHQVIVTFVRLGGSFLRWLSSGDGIFHIAGKLGSGKSTLMKFLCEHPCTIWQLQKWAGMSPKSLIFTLTH